MNDAAYVAYFRVSTEIQGRSGLGLEAQRAVVVQFVTARGGSIVAEYTEVESGRKSERPELAKALDLCRRKKVPLVIAKLDRLARNVALIANLMESRIEFVAVDMPDANRLTVHIMAAMAEHEREMISQRTKAALAAAKARGVVLGQNIGELVARQIADADAFAVRMGKVFRWAVKQKLLDAVPTVERIPEQLLADVVVPTLEEVRRIIDALPKETVAVVWFLALTGCRPGEAYNLTWDCVDEVNGWVEIRPKDGWKPKNPNSIRRLPVEGMLLDLIRQQPKVSRFVFPSTVDPEKARTNMRKAFASAVKKAKIVRNGKPVLDIKPKYLRKAFATWHAEQGLHPRVLQALMGHAPGSTVTDRHYIKPQEEAMRAAVVRMLPTDERNKTGS